MTGNHSGTLLERKGESRGRMPQSDAPLAPHESLLIGHLLGRREDAPAIARALGLRLPEVHDLCEGLLARGLLKLNDPAGKRLYSVH